MSDSSIPEIQAILTEVDVLLRERLKALGFDIGHVLLVVALDGGGVIRRNVRPAELGDMAEVLAEIANGAVLQRPDDEPLRQASGVRVGRMFPRFLLRITP